MRSPSLCPDLPWVGMDNGRIGEMVAEHFLNRGYRHFAVYTLEREPFFRERVENYLSCLDQRGLTCSVLPSGHQTRDVDWESTQQRLRDWLEELEKPVGVFAANDQLGARLLDS